MNRTTTQGVTASRWAIERATPGDVVTLAMDMGPVPSHIGAVLRFAGIPGGDPAALERLVVERVGPLPRLRQRLAPAPLGCGPPVWVDDPAADPVRHVHRVPCPAPGDERALLDLAARVMTTPLPPARPLWSATVVTRTRVAPLRALAHRHDATVNDAVLVAVTAALHDLLAARGEAVDLIAAGVPVSTRHSISAAALGNQVAPILVTVPVTGGMTDRLERVAATVRAGRAAATQPPPAGVATAMWWAARLHLLRHYMTHQRRMHTMISSLHGPDEHVTVGGSTVVSITPLVAAETGNVRVSFDVLTYAGTVTITTVADPDTVPDLPDLTTALAHALDALADIPARR